MGRGARGIRIGQEIQRLLATVLRSELKDPRVTALVTITDVDVSPDLRHAKVLVTLLGTPDACETTLQALNGCSAFLRHCLSQRMRLRAIPELKFVYDASVERGARITRLIAAAVDGKSDANGSKE